MNEWDLSITTPYFAKLKVKKNSVSVLKLSKLNRPPSLDDVTRPDIGVTSRA